MQRRVVRCLVNIYPLDALFTKMRGRLYVAGDASGRRRPQGAISWGRPASPVVGAVKFVTISRDLLFSTFRVRGPSTSITTIPLIWPQ